MKKWLSVILTAILLFSAMPTGLFGIVANAATSGTTGDCTWTLDGTELTISGNGAMGDYYSYQTWDSSITTVTINDGVTRIGDYAFNGCSDLTSITIPDSVTSIGNYAFQKCNSLSSITIPGSVTSIGYFAFIGCSSLTAINVDADNQHYCSNDGVLFNKDKIELLCFPAGRSDKYVIPDGVTVIDGFAFNGCSSLASIIIPNSVTSIGNYAFDGCSSLISITIPGSVTSIGDSAFSGCNSLTAINVDDENKTYSSNDGVLFNKDKTELLCFPTGKSGKYIMPYGVTSINSCAFFYCSGLTSINIPYSVTYIGNYAFGGCSSLTSITIPDSVTSIEGEAFSDCSSLADITISNNITWIGFYMFSGCSSLTSITIPNGVTSIDSGAFGGCSSLTSITIPDSVTDIGNAAFGGCSMLKNVYYYGNEDDKNNISIGSNNTYLENAQWHYNFRYGDANGDGIINSLDLTELKIIILSGETNYDSNTACDVTGDKRIDILDLVRLKKYFAGVDVSLGKS